MSLYNCKSDGDQYRISKFSNDLDVEASYLTSNDGCDCPAGHRPVCRHRIMLPRFIAKNATAGQWFHNYEHNQWIRALSDDEPDTLGDLASAASEVTSPIEGEILTNLSLNEFAARTFGGMKDITPKPINLLELAEIKTSITKTFELGDFPWNCYDQGKCESATDCIMYGCAKGNGHPPRQSTEPKPLRRL